MKMIEITKDYFGENLNIRDKVIIRYRGKDFLKSGTINYIYSGDCSVDLDFEDLVVKFFGTNVVKIEHVVCEETGETFSMPTGRVMDLFGIGILKYDKQKNYIYFRGRDFDIIENSIISNKLIREA